MFEYSLSALAQRSQHEQAKRDFIFQEHRRIFNHAIEVIWDIYYPGLYTPLKIAPL